MLVCSESGLPLGECGCCAGCRAGRDGSPCREEIVRLCEELREGWPDFRLLGRSGEAVGGVRVRGGFWC